MKTIIFAISLITGAVHAQVIECPAADGGANLLGAGIYTGENKQFELIGDRRAVRNGADAVFGFKGGEAKWVACWYTPARARWDRIKPAVKQCTLTERTRPAQTVTATVQCN